MNKPGMLQSDEIQRARETGRKLGSTPEHSDMGLSDAARRLFAGLSAANYHALLVPQTHGGGGLDYATAGQIYEELSYHGIGFMPTLLTNAHCAELLKIAGNRQSEQGFLKKIGSDGRIFGFCLTEEDAGSDITGIRCMADQAGDGYVINGEKSIVINNSIADFFIVIATTDFSKGRAGLNAFVVDASSPGVERGESVRGFGFGNSVIGKVGFRNVAIPRENMLGEEGSGYFLVMETFDKGRPLVAASCAGAAGRLLDIVTAHVRRREQFGKPLFSFQGISFRLADLATRLRASRLLYLDALALIDEGREFTMEASMAKLFASETLRDLAEFCLEALGYRAFEADSEARNIFNDAQLLISIDGSSNVQRMVIASQL
ncbi:MAG TPA: acyl-CoA dehydrogenase family protein [Spirochaetota bacterium]|nr:acyl-CoA dehydrogenase family protein [Spirochaetota bacterium]